MMKKILLLLIFPIFCWSETISIIVPCYFKHFDHIPDLLQAIAKQTQLPDEVVISVSESEKLTEEQRNRVTNCKTPFNVKIIFNKQQLFAGENRNISCLNAAGTILISQDADDLPHPQRVEILSACFKQYPHVQQIIHRYVVGKETTNNTSFLLKNVHKTVVTNWDQYMKIPNFTTLHNGNCAIRRKVFEKIRWTNLPRGQDVEFNKKVIETFRKTMVIDAELLTYRPHLSSLNSIKRKK